ncbi:D-2-hydroxyacid dehydrogenase [Microvirga flavescens]|uniref:D-2-hydroxyacid dehydrogenase n=1 Tax=Microvirga flavescens TaxID=2249811 RepID=UPI0018E08710|nr:D-2-hydroxyacid dehydrogenase [Microvirga flavescens]
MSSVKQTIFITSPLEPEHVARVRAVSPEVEVIYEPDCLPPIRYIADHDGREDFRRTPEQEERWRAALARATILFDFPSDGLASAPNVRWVQTTSSGVGRRVHALGLADSDLLVTTARGVHADSLTEFVFLVLLMHAKDLPRLQKDQAERRWDRYCCGELAGKTIAVVGAGQIGARTGTIAKAFGMRVLALVNSPAPERRAELSADDVFGQDDLHKVLGAADYVVLATPHTPQTDRMIDAAAIAAMKPGVVLINIARGQVVDEPAMIEALKRGHIGFAGLDVQAVEPLPLDSPLWSLPNVLISPHSASTAPSENGKITDIFCRNLTHYLAGELGAMVNVLDKKRMY